MFYVYFQQQNKIEIVVSGDLSEDEFVQIIHQLESLCAMYNEVEVLIDASQIRNYDFSIILEELEFYSRYHQRLRKVAIVGDDKFVNFLLKIFNRFTRTEFKTYSPEEIKEAREWIFPSRLPG